MLQSIGQSQLYGDYTETSVSSTTARLFKNFFATLGCHIATTNHHLAVC